MVSAASSPYNVQQAIRNKCDGFLVKPIRRDVLHKKLLELGLACEEAAPGAKAN
jgi:hypothetical protein